MRAASPRRMSLIERFLPEYELRQVDRIAVAADPDLAYRAVRALDTQSLLMARALFQLRSLPDRLHGRSAPEPRRMTIDQIVRPGSGFLLLGEERGHELVVGSIGKFWLPEIEFASVTPEEFTSFDQPGFGKLAWNLRVDPRVGGGCWLGMELRVTATDPESLAKFARYWRVIGRFSHAIRRAALRELRRELGHTEPDSIRSMPGDELLPQTTLQATHSVTIEAPTDRVWPWLVQMGCRRGGWYSYDWLDNGGVPSAEQIVPELQQIAVGDLLPATPSDAEGFAVLEVEPGRALVLGAPELLSQPPPSHRPWPYPVTWAFLLEPVGESATRLSVRVRAFVDKLSGRLMVGTLLVPVHELMQRKQLANLKRRAEAHVS